MVLESNTIVIIAEFASLGGTRTYLEGLLRLCSELNSKAILVMHNSEAQRLAWLALEKELKSQEILPYRVHFVSFFPMWGGRQVLLHRWLFDFIFCRFFILPVIRKYKPRKVVVSVGTPWRFFMLFSPLFDVLYILHTVPRRMPIGKFSFVFFSRVCNIEAITKRTMLAVSGYQASVLRSYWIFRKYKIPITTIPNCVIKKIVPQKFSYSDFSSLHSGSRIKILTVGHVEGYKNPEFWFQVACDVLAAGYDVCWTWIGEGSLYKKYVYLSRKYSAITFFGYKKNMEEEYKNYNIYFQPSKKESFGISVVEAMAAGLPCVVSNSEGLPELVVHQETGFIFPRENKREAISLLIELIEKPDLRLQLGQAARQKFIERYTYGAWRDNIKKILF